MDVDLFPCHAHESEPRIVGARGDGVSENLLMRRHRWVPWRAIAMLVGVCLLLVGCASGGVAGAATATSTVRAAADATAKASGFTFVLPGAEVTYNAPDRIEQVEHGEASISAGGTGIPASSTGPVPATITKIIIGDRYYEANTIEGQPPTFTVSKRCPPDNAADSVLEVLRAVAANGEAEGSDGRYTFTVPASATAAQIAGTVTLDAGYIRQLVVTSGTLAPAVTIESIGAAPAVTEPANVSPNNGSCDSGNSAGSSSASPSASSS